MKNKIMTCAALALTTLLAAGCLSSCGLFDGQDTKNNGSAETPSNVVSDIVDDIAPDLDNGETVEKNSDEYTADEKDENFSMTDINNGK